MVGLSSTGRGHIVDLGRLHDARSEPDGSVSPGPQVRGGQPVLLDLQRAVCLVEVVGVEERHPAVRVGRRQDGHGLALLHDVRPERPPVPVVIVGVLLASHPDGIRRSVVVDQHQPGPVDVPVVEQELVLVHQYGASLPVVAGILTCDRLLRISLPASTAQQVRPQICDSLKHLN